MEYSMYTKNFMVLIYFLLFSMFLDQNVQAQYLVKMNSDIQIDLLNNSHNWTYEINGIQFATVPDLSVLDNQGMEYNILANNIETGKYYWVESRFASFLNISEISDDQNAEILWYNSKTALMKVKNDKLFSERLPREYAIRKINFNRSASRRNADYSSDKNFLKKGATNLVQTIIDSVSIGEMYLTEEHLTGERPFWLNGHLDSLQTRYSYSPQIHKAKDYLQSRLEEYGYIVDYLPFSVESQILYDIKFPDSNLDFGWMVGGGKIYGTSDRGNSWTLQYEDSLLNIKSVFPYSQNLVFAVGGFGVVLKTTDGLNWQQMTTPTSYYLYGVHFKTETLGWICGMNGLILKTVNGGNSWTIKNTPTSQTLTDITFMDNRTGWAVGNNGTIIFTNDFGETWTLQSTPTTNQLKSVYFKTENEGFAVGYNTVLHSTNGGSDWDTLSMPTNGDFKDIDFFGQNHGIIVGGFGNPLCFITTNGGISWSSAGNYFYQFIRTVELIDTSEVWICGASTVAKSTDFGSSWLKIPFGNLKNLIATKRGTTYPDQHYIVCAHYDADSENPIVCAPGADDNGSGTAAVIEAARVLADYNFNYSIKFTLFAGEEQGKVGSDAYAYNAFATGEQIQGVLNMDMIGYDGNNDNLMEIHAGNLVGSQSIGSYMVSNISSFGLSLTAEYKTSNSSTASDHSSFWSYGFPAIMHIEDFQDFTPHYHTSNDLLSSLNLPYYLENAKLTIGTLALLAEIDSISANLPNHESIPAGFSLSEPYPNPFNPIVNIKYSLNSPDHVKIDIFDVLGKKIKSLVNDYQKGNEYHITWNGLNGNNRQAASGIYLIRLNVGDKTQIKKVVLMR